MKCTDCNEKLKEVGEVKIYKIFDGDEKELSNDEIKKIREGKVDSTIDDRPKTFKIVNEFSCENKNCNTNTLAFIRYVTDIRNVSINI